MFPPPFWHGGPSAPPPPPPPPPWSVPQNANRLSSQGFGRLLYIQKGKGEERSGSRYRTEAPSHTRRGEKPTSFLFFFLLFASADLSSFSPRQLEGEQSLFASFLLQARGGRDRVGDFKTRGRRDQFGNFFPSNSLFGFFRLKKICFIQSWIYPTRVYHCVVSCVVCITAS